MFLSSCAVYILLECLNLEDRENNCILIISERETVKLHHYTPPPEPSEPCRRGHRKVERDSELSQGNGLSWAWQYT